MAVARRVAPQCAFDFPDAQPTRPRPLQRNPPVLDAVAAQAAKVAGQDRAAANAADWAEDVVVEFGLWASRRARAQQLTFVLEEFRAVARSQPDSHKAWGSLPRVLQAAGLIRAATHPDGSPRYQRSTSVKTHGHPVRMWEIA